MALPSGRGGSCADYTAVGCPLRGDRSEMGRVARKLMEAYR